MSHFTVIIFGAKTQEEVEKKLWSYWELDLPEEELKKDPRAKFIDKTDEVEKRIFEESEFVITPDGRVLRPWDNELRVPNTIGMSSTSHYVPEGYKKTTLPFTEYIKSKYNNNYKAFIENWFDYVQDPETGAWGYYANPNAKWDWYTIGGRWRGYFPIKLKSSSVIGEGKIVEIADQKLINTFLSKTGYSLGELDNIVSLFLKAGYSNSFKKIFDNLDLECKEILTEILRQLFVDGPMLGEISWTNREKPSIQFVGYTDIVQKKHVDVDRARRKFARYAEDARSVFEPLLKKYPDTLSWKMVLEKFGVSDKNLSKIDDARGFFRNQPLVSTIRSNDEWDKKYGFDVSDYLEDILDECEGDFDKYIELVSSRALVPFAFIDLNGEWHERGEMGYWAFVSNEKKESEWQQEFWNVWNEVDDETWMTLVDCHI